MRTGTYALVTVVIEVVVMIFGAFGASILDMFPEQIEKTSFATGYAAFCSVLIFLVIRVASERLGWRTGVFAGLFLLSVIAYVAGGIWYRDSLDDKLFRYPNPQDGDLYLVGCERTEPAEVAVAREDRLRDPLLLVFEFGARPEHNFSRVWTYEGLAKCRQRIFLHYMAVVAALVFAIGCASEAVARAVGAGGKRLSHRCEIRMLITVETNEKRRLLRTRTTLRPLREGLSTRQRGKER